MELAELYYYQMHGYYPYDRNKKPLKKTKKVIEYMRESQIKDEDIVKVIMEAPQANFLTPEALPDWLWNESLTEKGQFYFHHLLHITSKAPKLNTKTDKIDKENFYLEMKIRFTMEDLLNYYYKKNNMVYEIRNYNKDRGAFNKLFERYNKISFVPVLDFILTLIDIAAQDEYRNITSPFDLENYAKEAYAMLKAKVQEAEIEGNNKIIWR